MSKSISLLTLVLCLAGNASDVAQAQDKVLLAVFAHPDDEVSVGPLLARYAREGVDVHLAIITRAETFAPQTDLSPGEEIAELRVQEARCAARRLGIKPPILLQFDNDLGKRVVPPWATLSRVGGKLSELFAALRPDVVITWGPDGGYGHADHRLTSAIVTELVQRKVEGAPVHLLYGGIPADRVPDGPSPGSIPWLPVDMEYLTVHVPFTQADLDSATEAFSCYVSQYSEQQIEFLSRKSAEVWRGSIYLRPWNGGVRGNDIFDLKRVGE